MDNLSKTSSKKDIPNSNDSLLRLRFIRLRRNISLLGQPDIISIHKTKTSSSLFSRQKKNQYSSQYFVNGIIFQTTAHFSSYVSSKYQQVQAGSKQTVHIRAKLLMFDAFQQKDIHVQINIPGSLQLKVYNLSGQLIKPQFQDYQRAYFSSYLRSLQPMNYPNIVLSPYIYKLQIHKQILQKLIPFCFQNSLRELKYSIRYQFTKELQIQYQGNLIIQILIHFAIRNRFFTLIEIIILELEKLNQEKYQFKDMQFIKSKIKYEQKKYPELLKQSSMILMSNPNINSWKQLQLECLYKQGNYIQASELGLHLLHLGLTSSRPMQYLCLSLLQQSLFAQFLCILNTILSLASSQVPIPSISHYTKRLYFMDIVFNKGQNISSYPQLCFGFDKEFLQKQNHYVNFRKQLQDKDDTQLKQFIGRLDKSLNHQPDNHQNNTYNLQQAYSWLVRFQKAKGWSQVIKIRAQCFWLEDDFKGQQKQILQHSYLSNTSISNSTQKSPKKAQIPTSLSRIQLFQSQKSQTKQVKYDKTNDFDEAGFSDPDEQQVIEGMPACSKRVNHNPHTTRHKLLKHQKSNSPKKVKVLCCPSLQKLFIHLYQDLKLQMQLQKWCSSLSSLKISTLPSAKRELYCILLLLKSFLHQKLERHKKCEQTLKLCRTISQFPSLTLISTYQLIQLYIKNQSMKGVEYYIFDFVKILGVYGIRKFDVVPEWAKNVIKFVVDKQGPSIVNQLQGPFKQLVVRWLRNNHTQNQLLNNQIQPKNQVQPKNQARPKNQVQSHKKQHNKNQQNKTIK